MSEARRKGKRIDPLVHVRQLQLDQQATVLASIRQEKLAVQATLLKNQQQYIEGVNNLNRVRQSSEREYLGALESGLDYVKGKWYRTLKELREIERREQAQLSLVLVAQRNLQTMETLQNRYEMQARAHQDKVEQKVLDEVALRQFNNK